MHVLDCSISWCALRFEGHSRLSRGLCYEHVWHLKARLQRFQLIYLHPRHVPLQPVELQQQMHLQIARQQCQTQAVVKRGEQETKSQVLLQ